MNLNVETRTDTGRVILAVSGEVDVHTAPALRNQISDVLASGRSDLVVDLSGVDFLDSSGLGVLVAGLTAARAEGGDLSLVCSRPSLVKLLEITGLDQVMTVHATAADALAGPPHTGS